ncbi:unnamed protein product [Ixodes pacificus]
MPTGRERRIVPKVDGSLSLSLCALHGGAHETWLRIAFSLRLSEGGLDVAHGGFVLSNRGATDKVGNDNT